MGNGEKSKIRVDVFDIGICVLKVNEIFQVDVIFGYRGACQLP